jgi:hypothetical protein
MMLRFAAAIVIAFLLGGPVLAESGDIPSYDIDSLCRAAYEHSQASVASRNLLVMQCVSQNGGAYGFVQLAWPAAPDQARAFCVDKVDAESKQLGPDGRSTVIYPYLVLKACITPRLDQDRLEQQGPFRR